MPRREAFEYLFSFYTIFGAPKRKKKRWLNDAMTRFESSYLNWITYYGDNFLKANFPTFKTSSRTVTGLILSKKFKFEKLLSHKWVS